jgi:DeoR/GlpR family transcriptional regulator of sugar metabolism
MAMNAKARRTAIETLARDGEVEIAHLAQQFSVSEMTIRRDFESLEEAGALRRLVGGRGIAVEQKTHEPALMARELDRTANKAHIARAAAELINADEAVYIDGGTTALAIAKELRRREIPLTVVTRSLLVAVEFCQATNVDIHLLGGKVKTAEMLTTSQTHPDDLASYNVDTYLMGISGIHPTRGLTDYDPDEAAGKRVAISRADRVVLAFDDSKLDRVLLSTVATLEDIDVLVTDASPDHPALTGLPPNLALVLVDPASEASSPVVDAALV